MPLLMVLESVVLLTLCRAVVLGLILCLLIGYPLADRDTANRSPQPRPSSWQ